MRKHVITFWLCLVAMIFGPVAAAHAGLIVVRTMGDPMGTQTVKQTYYMEGARFAIIGEDGNGQIFDADRQLAWTYNTHLKTYTKINRAQAEAARAQMNAFAEQMKHMPPDVRKRMEAADAARSAGPTLKRMGKEKSVRQWRCTPVAGYMAGRDEPVMTMCVASFSELGMTASDIKLMHHIQKMADKLTVMSSASGQRMEAGLKKIGLDGMPVEIQRANGGKIDVLSVSHGAIPSGVFELPKGLHEQSLPMFQ